MKVRNASTTGRQCLPPQRFPGSSLTPSRPAQVPIWLLVRAFWLSPFVSRFQLGAPCTCKHPPKAVFSRSPDQTRNWLTVLPGCQNPNRTFRNRAAPGVAAMGGWTSPTYPWLARGLPPAELTIHFPHSEVGKDVSGHPRRFKLPRPISPSMSGQRSSPAPMATAVACLTSPGRARVCGSPNRTVLPRWRTCRRSRRRSLPAVCGRLWQPHRRPHRSPLGLGRP